MANAESYQESLQAVIAQVMSTTLEEAHPMGPDKVPEGWTTRAGDAKSSLYDPTAARRHGLVGVHACDPDFDPAAFLNLVGEMFVAYHRADDLGTLDPARRFLAAEIFPTLAIQTGVRGPRPGGARPVIFHALRPITAFREGDTEMVRMFISATLGDSEEPTAEYWRLVRKLGARTKSGYDLTHCPSCGGPVNGDDLARCGYCGQSFADPNLEWVVAEIEAQ